MKKEVSLVAILYFLLLFPALSRIQAQTSDCVFKAPIFNMDFGSSQQPAELEFSSTEIYRQVKNYCPQDGNYTIVSYTGDCFGGNWLTLDHDHTANDIDGKMLLVNAAYTPGLFFVAELKGLLPNTSYEVAAWLLNICRPHYDCTNNMPDLRFIIENSEGKELARFSTGQVAPTGIVSWLQYSGQFKSPANAGTLYLKIENKEEGGCGNDFALDDITVRECMVPKPLVKEAPKTKPVVKQIIPVNKPVIKKLPPVAAPVKKITPNITKAPVRDSIVAPRSVIRERPVISYPNPILTRSNPIVKQIETVKAEIQIDLYDNGEIDGDTVSVYHNNVLIVSRAGLSAKPITFYISVDESHPHHDLVMVANNLGSIPPNTSLMIVTAKDKRYEVFISSTEQKNAKVKIDLKE